MLQSKTGTNATKYVYALGTRPLAQNSGVWEYLLPNALGSVRQIVDANGNVTLAESYEPYGSVLSSNGTASSIFGYAGEQNDTYIKLPFLQMIFSQVIIRHMQTAADSHLRNNCYAFQLSPCFSKGLLWR